MRSRHRPREKRKVKWKDCLFGRRALILEIAEEKREIVGILYPHTRYEGTLPVYYTMHLLNKIEQLHPHAL